MRGGDGGRKKEAGGATVAYCLHESQSRTCCRPAIGCGSAGALHWNGTKLFFSFFILISLVLLMVGSLLLNSHQERYEVQCSQSNVVWRRGEDDWLKFNVFAVMRLKCFQMG